jgi:hypothetical protein
MDKPIRHVFNSERLFVKDDNGYVEVFDAILIWSNPDIYIWINSCHDDDIMLHFFELA